MSRDYDFEIQFWEDVLRRNRDDGPVLEALANLYTKTGRIDDGLKLDRRRVRNEPNNPTAHYNLACSLALKNRRADALRTLRAALELGFRDFAWMRKDPDLKTISGSGAFRELLNRFEKSKVS